MSYASDVIGARDYILRSSHIGEADHSGIRAVLLPLTRHNPSDGLEHDLNVYFLAHIGETGGLNKPGVRCILNQFLRYHHEI